LKQIRIFLLLALFIFSAAALQQNISRAAAANAARPQQSQQTPPTIASTVDLEISAIEKQSVEVAEAMPEGKYNFSRESLNIPGSDLTPSRR